jgi:hypothetical protein
MEFIPLGFIPIQYRASLPPYQAEVFLHSPLEFLKGAADPGVDSLAGWGFWDSRDFTVQKGDFSCKPMSF